MSEGFRHAVSRHCRSEGFVAWQKRWRANMEKKNVTAPQSDVEKAALLTEAAEYLENAAIVAANRSGPSHAPENKRQWVLAQAVRAALGDRQWNAATEDEINAVAHVTGNTAYNMNETNLSVESARKVAAATIAAFLCLRRPATGEG